MTQPTIFISYSHADEEWKDRLEKQLEVLELEGRFEVWSDRDIQPDVDWYPQIEAAINRASLAILLVSADFLTSDFIRREEIPRLLARRKQEGLVVFPIMLRPCPWQRVDWLAKIPIHPKDGQPLSSFSNEHQIEATLTEIVIEIAKLLQPLPPYSPTPYSLLPTPQIALARLPNTGEHLFGREDQLVQLDAAWDDARTHIFSLVAWGGVGKSALANRWLQQVEDDQFRGARRVYAWSFYSQGASEDRAVSADLFIDDALRWFGDPDPAAGSPWDKGERLAGLIRRERTLLILDGLEPLQRPPGPDGGKLTDPSMQALLRELGFHNPGLCLISTRLKVADLDRFQGTSAQRLDLAHLSPEAGADFLKAQGVKGKRPELLAASRAFKGHALALTLLGGYLRDAFNGDVRRRKEIGPLMVEGVTQGRHARRVMQAYEQWFGDGPEQAILRLLGLFDRPADAPSLAALREGPPIAGLTEPLFGSTSARRSSQMSTEKSDLSATQSAPSVDPVSQRDWNLAVANLRRARLLARPRPRRAGHPRRPPPGPRALRRPTSKPAPPPPGARATTASTGISKPPPKTNPTPWPR